MSAESETKELETLHSKDESFPKGLTPLEELFDFNEVENKSKLEPVETKVEECNIGSEEKPKMIKLSKTLPAHIKLKYIELFKDFSDVFAWSYEDLKSYDTEIIQHQEPKTIQTETAQNKPRPVAIG